MNTPSSVEYVIAFAAVVTAIGTLWYAYKTRELVEATKTMIEEQSRAAKLNLELSVHMKLEEQWDGPRLKAARSRLADVVNRRLLVEFTEPVQAARDCLALLEDGPDDDVFEFFESLGFYIKRHFDDFEMAWNTFGYHCLGWWALSEKYILKLREERGDPLIFTEFEGLARRFSNFETSRSGVWVLGSISDQDLDRFVADESALQVEG